MDIKVFQHEILDVFSRMDKVPNRRPHTKQSAVIHLVEEIGEVARQVTNEYHWPEKFDKENFGSELADVLMFIVLLAKLYDVDISKEMETSIQRVKDKVAKVSNIA
ncbi:MAG: MazG nucleotide pyrophosphohydrolase domain-containing protein [Parcubacteria group bacterium]